MKTLCHWIWLCWLRWIRFSWDVYERIQGEERWSQIKLKVRLLKKYKKLSKSRILSIFELKLSSCMSPRLLKLYFGCYLGSARTRETISILLNCTQSFWLKNLFLCTKNYTECLWFSALRYNTTHISRTLICLPFFKIQNTLFDFEPRKLQHLLSI